MGQERRACCYYSVPCMQKAWVAVCCNRSSTLIIVALAWLGLTWLDFSSGAIAVVPMIIVLLTRHRVVLKTHRPNILSNILLVKNAPPSFRLVTANTARLYSIDIHVMS